MRVTGRLCGVIATAAWLMLALSHPGAAQEWRYGGTLFGELKYGPDFAHYDHVNPDAPKGGTLNEDALGSFDSFNPFIVRGRAAAGLTYFGGKLYDTLMEQSIDQSSASYGLVADAFRFPDDYSSATYRLNPKARFHDGKPITPEDVIWSFETWTEYQPYMGLYYEDVASVSQVGERTVRLEGRERTQTLTVETPDRPARVELDPDRKMLDRDRSNNVREPGGG